MTLNRTSKSLIIVLAIALIAGLGGLLCAGARAPVRPSPPRSVTQMPETPAVPALASAANSPTPVTVQVANRNADDSRCVIKTPPSPTVADVGTVDKPDEAVAHSAIPRDVARERILARMKSSADPYANAVAVWLDVHNDDGALQSAERVRQLAAMAVSTGDPRLYSLALRTCWGKAGHECESLSARRWSELDPGNAMPWMMMLDEAARRQDVSGVEEALFHVTKSERLAEREMAPLQPIVDAASEDPESLAAARSMSMDAIGISAAQVDPIGFTACERASPADANVWQQCVAMVDLLEHHSDSLMARMTGASIDRTLTGNTKPAQQFAALMNQKMSLDLAAAVGCEDLRAKLAFLRRMAVEGEVSAAQGLAR